MLVTYEDPSQPIGRLRGHSEPPTPESPEAPFQRTKLDCVGSELVALADTSLTSRFSAWQGLSGRRYVFSVYPAADCPAFRDALLLAAVRDPGGRRRALAIVDTGAFPESIVTGMQRELRGYGSNLEFHLHLLAQSPAGRNAALVDLRAGSAENGAASP